MNNVPIGEAMVAYREKSGDEDASQTFVPFIAVSETNKMLDIKRHNYGKPGGALSPTVDIFWLI